MDRAETVLRFIIDELIDESDIDILPETSLFQDRVLDSLNLVTLIEFLEETFSIKISTSEVTMENLDSINKICNFLDNKTAD